MRAGSRADTSPMDIFSLLDELRVLAQNGLHFATNPYDRERYERLFELTTQTYGELLDLPKETIRARFQNDLGYITPKVGGMLPSSTRKARSC